MASPIVARARDPKPMPLQFQNKSQIDTFRHSFEIKIVTAVIITLVISHKPGTASKALPLRPFWVWGLRHHFVGLRVATPFRQKDGCLLGILNIELLP